MAKVFTLPSQSIRSRVTPGEWQARVDLAACYRLAGLYEMSDMMANHISSRVPGEEWPALLRKLDRLDPSYRE